MSEIQTLVDEFIQAISSDDYFKAEVKADQLRTTYENRALENQLYRQSIAARDNSNIDEKTQTEFNKYIGTSSNVGFVRSSFLFHAGSFLSDPENLDDGDMVDMSNSLKESEEKYNENKDKVQSLIQKIELPPTVEVLSVGIPKPPHPKGGSFSLSILVKNVGDIKVEGAKIEVTGTSGITIEPNTVTVGTLGPGTETETIFDVGLEKTGTSTISVTLTSNNAASSTDEITFNVVNKEDIVQVADSNIAKLINWIDDLKANKGTKRSLISKLEAAQAKLDDALRFIDEDKSKQADNMINAAINILGAFLNVLVDSSPRKNLDKKEVDFLKDQGNYTIDVLSTAKEKGEDDEDEEEDEDEDDDEGRDGGGPGRGRGNGQDNR